MDRRILVVDDSELTCQQLSQLLALPDRQIKVAHDGTSALELLVERNFSLVLTDLLLPGIQGLDLIQEIRRRDLPVTTIVMTAHGSVDTAVEAMKLGAYDYLHQAHRRRSAWKSWSSRRWKTASSWTRSRRCATACGSATPTTTCWARALGCARSSPGWRGWPRPRARS